MYFYSNGHVVCATTNPSYHILVLQDYSKLRNCYILQGFRLWKKFCSDLYISETHASWLVSLPNANSSASEIPGDVPDTETLDNFPKFQEYLRRTGVTWFALLANEPVTCSQLLCETSSSYAQRPRRFRTFVRPPHEFQIRTREQALQPLPWTLTRTAETSTSSQVAY